MTSRSLTQRRTTECVCVCLNMGYLESSTMGWPELQLACCAKKMSPQFKKNHHLCFLPQAPVLKFPSLSRDPNSPGACGSMPANRYGPLSSLKLNMIQNHHRFFKRTLYMSSQATDTIRTALAGRVFFFNAVVRDKVRLLLPLNIVHILRILT